MLVGGLGLGAAWRRLRRTPSVAPELDPAEGLRAKLAASKAGGETASPGAPVEGESPGLGAVVDEPAPLDPAARRRAIHDRARGAMDELR